MFFRFLLVALLAAVLIRAIRQGLLRRQQRAEARQQSSRDLGVDPESIRDADFTDMGGKEEAHK